MRINQCFQKLHASNKKALIPYITAGDPDPATTVDTMHQLVRSGGNIIELGFPFSDPVADGPIIAHAHERALARGVTLNDVLSMVATFRKDDNITPIVLMGYINPIEIMGYEQFAQRAYDAGVDGVLVVDLPPEAATPLVKKLHERNLDMINLVAPTTSDARIQKICKIATGYLYYVSLKGITGSANLDIHDVAHRVAHIKHFTTLPVGVGFGIKNAQSAGAVSAVADAVIVGSVLISALNTPSASGEYSLDTINKLITDMRVTMDRSC